jgi:V8-like Glu-specific endopeptidase
MPRSRSLALIVAAALTAALAPAALASAAAPAKGDNAKAEHDRIVAYWTPERMKAAKPRDFVRQKDGSFRLAPTPKAKPGGATTSTAVKGASWTKGGDVLKRTGKVYFTMSGVGYVCSGSVANDGTRGGNSIVLTAGHCVYDESKTDNSGWARNWLFIPDFDTKPNLVPTNCASADTTYGCWTALSLVAHSGFTTAGSFTTGATQHDFAFAVVGLGGNKNSALDERVGAYEVATSGVAPRDTLSAFGYPAAGKYSSGKDLTYCSGPITTDSLNSNLTWGMACDMTGGSSGGPWLKGIDVTSATATAGAGSGGTLSSLNSYGYSGRSYMYGPMFNEETTKVLDQAKANSTSGSTTDVAVP